LVFLGWVVLFLDLGLISPLSVRFVGNDFTGINIKGDVFAMIKRGFKHNFIDLL
jgi:hypothetical protein